jgi:hypothetical protein
MEEAGILEYDVKQIPNNLWKENKGKDAARKKYFATTVTLVLSMKGGKLEAILYDSLRSEITRTSLKM